MPQILVLADAPRGSQGSGEVVYRERVARSCMESEHFAGQLMERVGWAVGDADEMENKAQEVVALEHPVAPPAFVGR